MSNFTKWHFTHEIFRILPVFSKFLWNLTFTFSDSHNNFPRRYYRWLITSLALAKCKKNAIFLLFWYKVLVHWKLKLLNFPVDSILIITNVHMYVFYSWCCAKQVAKINTEQFQWPCLRVFMPLNNDVYFCKFM